MRIFLSLGAHSEDGTVAEHEVRAPLLLLSGLGQILQLGSGMSHEDPCVSVLYLFPGNEMSDLSFAMGFCLYMSPHV